MKDETAMVEARGEAMRRRMARRARRVAIQKTKLRAKRAWMEGWPRRAKRAALV